MPYLPMGVESAGLSFPVTEFEFCDFWAQLFWPTEMQLIIHFPILFLTNNLYIGMQKIIYFNSH